MSEVFADPLAYTTVGFMLFGLLMMGAIQSRLATIVIVTLLVIVFVASA